MAEIENTDNSVSLLPVAFYFRIKIDNAELSFKEASGLETELEVEDIAEGGNYYGYKAPKQFKHGNLVLKRAIRTSLTDEVSWIKNTVENDTFDKIVTKDILISLLNEKSKPMATWNCTRAFPVKWSIDTLDAEKNSVLIESIEFTYTRLIRQQ